MTLRERWRETKLVDCRVRRIGTDQRRKNDDDEYGAQEDGGAQGDAVPRESGQTPGGCDGQWRVDRAGLGCEYAHRILRARDILLRRHAHLSRSRGSISTFMKSTRIFTMTKLR